MACALGGARPRGAAAGRGRGGSLPRRAPTREWAEARYVCPALRAWPASTLCMSLSLNICPATHPLPLKTSLFRVQSFKTASTIPVYVPVYLYYLSKPFACWPIKFGPQPAPTCYPLATPRAESYITPGLLPQAQPTSKHLARGYASPRPGQKLGPPQMSRDFR